jgi:hypothetical protein
MAGAVRHWRPSPFFFRLLFAWELGRSSIVDAITAAIAIVTVGLLAARINSAWLVLAGGIAGWVFK